MITYSVTGLALACIFSFVWMREFDLLAASANEDSIFILGVIIAGLTVLIWPLWAIVAPIMGAIILGYKFRKK